jgi:flagellar biosynthesis/type III secretory pathway protein FliH
MNACSVKHWRRRTHWVRSGPRGWHAAGIEEGYRRGEETERPGCTVLLPREAALAEIRETESQWVDARPRRTSPPLAVAVARQILDREVRGSTAAFGELVRRALAEFPLDERVRIRLHPSDLATISTLPGFRATSR